MATRLLSQVEGLYIIADSKMGRGVASIHHIPTESIIESCPVIMLSSADTQVIHSTRLHDYYFLWDTDQKTSAIALGYGSLYNHSESPNADYVLNDETQEIQFFAIKDIEAGDQILINYQTLLTEEYNLWFVEDQKV